MIKAFKANALLSVGIALIAGSAAAQDTTVFAVPTEVVTVGKATGGKFLETAFSVADYKYYATTYSESSGLKVFGAGKDKKKDISKYRFIKGDNAPMITGTCLIRSEENATVFGFSVDQKNSGLYKCDFGDLPATDYAFEVIVPQFATTTIGAMTIEKDDPHRWDVVKAKLLYKGVTYEAVPTGIDARREAFHRQPVKGYIVSRDGKPFGRLDFDFSGVQSALTPKGKITVPVTDENGREAIIFFASQLMAMPDVYKSSNAF